jgi:hypothetical protein
MTNQEQKAALQARLAEYEADAKSLSEGIANMQKNIAANNGALQYNVTLSDRIHKRIADLDAALVSAPVS